MHHPLVTTDSKITNPFRPDIIVETKKNELLNVFSRGPQKERDEVYECLMQLSPANVNDWDKIRQATNN